MVGSLLFCISISRLLNKRQRKPFPQKFKREMHRTPSVCNECFCCWAQPGLQGGRGITPLPNVCLGNGNHWRLPKPTLGHFLPQNRREWGREGLGEIYWLSKILEAKPWPAVAEIIVGWFVGLTLIILQSWQSGFQAVAASPSIKHSPESDLTWFWEKQEEAAWQPMQNI